MSANSLETDPYIYILHEALGHSSGKNKYGGCKVAFKRFGRFCLEKLNGIS